MCLFFIKIDHVRYVLLYRRLFSLVTIFAPSVAALGAFFMGNKKSHPETIQDDFFFMYYTFRITTRICTEAFCYLSQ